MSNNSITQFKQIFEKLTLTGVKDIGVLRLCNGIRCVKLVGRFECPFNLFNSLDTKAFLVMLKSCESQCGSFKYRKRVKTLVDGTPHVYLYEFDVIPNCVCGVDIKDGVLYLYAVGYGRETTLR